VTIGDQLLRSQVTIASLRANLPTNDYEVDEAWVQQFNEALGRIETVLGTHLDEFKVPQNALYRSVGSSNSITGDVTYREGLWCRRETLLHRIDSVLGYFTGLRNGRDREIGFHRS